MPDAEFDVANPASRLASSHQSRGRAVLRAETYRAVLAPLTLPAGAEGRRNFLRTHAGPAVGVVSAAMMRWPRGFI
jgi:hypothetical protein